MKNYDVVTCGEPMVLFSPDSGGPLRHVPLFRKFAAGAELNFSVALARLGLRPGFITKVGQDEFGQYIQACMQAEGLDTSMVKTDAAHPTGVYFKEYSGLADPKVYYYRHGSAASNLSPIDIDPECLEGARLLHITGITPSLSDSCRQTYLQLLDMATARQIPVCFDPNIRLKLISAEDVKEFMKPFIARAHILILNQSELNYLFNTQKLTEALSRIFGFGVELVILKQGANGAVAMRKGKSEAVSCPPFRPTRVVDQVGAGDGFDAGFIYGYLQGWPLEKSLRLANLVGALATTVVGDYEGYPFFSDAMRVLDSY
ncbi:MAG: sugar kinase [Desulfitobacteriaceae bacterium]